MYQQYKPLPRTRDLRNPKAFTIFFALSLILLLSSAAAAAELLIDTGPGSNDTSGGPALLSVGDTTCTPQPNCSLAFQFLGGEFTLDSEAELDSVEGWMALFQVGSIDVKIRANNNGIPGNVIFSKTYDLSNETPSSTPAWQVFPEFNVVLDAGTFWVTFEPVANSQFSASMPRGAPNPLENYAFLGNGNNDWVNFNLFGPNPGLGFRISGVSTAVAANIELSPRRGIAAGGVSETFTALVTTAEGTPVQGALVTFEITHGPHKGLVVTSLTDVNGHASFSYTETQGPGTDQIKAVIGDIESNTVRQTWQGHRPN